MERKIILNNEETNYIITDEGKVYNNCTKKQLMGTISAHGYRVITFSIKGKKINRYLHRLMAKYFLDYNEDGNLVINHKDGNKLNNSLSNLEIVSSSENLIHAYNNNLKLRNSQATIKFIDDLPGEEWKGIVGYEDYEVSTYGRVKSYKYNNPILLRQDTRCGYKSVVLSKNGKTKHFTIHELVYFTFSGLQKEPNKIIDHIDGNKENNSFSNLRYISQSENANASLYIQNNKDNRCKSVLAYKENYSKVFPSIAMASKELQIDNSSISKVCRGIGKTVHGFHFQFVEESSTVIERQCTSVREAERSLTEDMT